MKKPVNEDLLQRTKLFALRVIRLASALDSKRVARTLGNQLLRSGTSIGANYREAARARSKAEFIAKIGDCLREADESLYWIELLVESGFVGNEMLGSLRDECNQLVAILTSIHKRSKGL